MGGQEPDARAAELVVVERCPDSRRFCVQLKYPGRRPVTAFAHPNRQRAQEVADEVRGFVAALLAEPRPEPASPSADTREVAALDTREHTPVTAAPTDDVVGCA